MAKEPISARVPPRIADGVEEYAETWNMNRTDAIKVLLQIALQEQPHPRQVEPGVDLRPGERAYTVELEPENVEAIEEASDSPEEVINRVLSVYSPMSEG